jgi:ESCRT-II complex subunit VPS36
VLLRLRVHPSGLNVPPCCCPAAALQVGVLLRLRVYPSGLTVVTGPQHSDAAMTQRIGELLTSQTAKQQQQQAAAAAGAASDVALGAPLTASEVAAGLRLPLAIAREQLLVAESAGALCRDEGAEGLRFFTNFFSKL